MKSIIFWKFLLCLIPASVLVGQDASPDVRRRHVPLEGQSNFRDIGGYQTRSGKKVKWGTIFRSGELPKLTADDLRKIEKLNIKTVLNFLTEPEINAHGKDILPNGVKSISGPIDTDGNLAKQILEARKKADFSGIGPDLNPQIHRLLIQNSNARKEYARLFRLAADPKNHPVAFHCSHGVHRTGTGAALLLAALDVPWETIRKDYLLSNDFRKQEVQKRLEYFRNEVAKRKGIDADKVDMTNFEAFYVLKGSYIDATREEIEKKYGSFEAFFKKGLGLTDSDLQRLRRTLLED